MVALFLLYAVICSIIPMLGWQAASFDLNDPEAARAKYAEISAIEDLEESGRAWCGLSGRELRGIARHTEMSNTITTTTHTSSTGEMTTNTVIESAPNQDELVELAVKQIADSCRHNVWANAKKLLWAADDEERAEMLCQLTLEEATMLFRFFTTSTHSIDTKISISGSGESTETTVSGPSKPIDEREWAAMTEELSAQCGRDGG